MTLKEVVDVFCDGFAYTRSLTHEYRVIPFGPLKIMCDAPRTSGDYRKQEVVVCGVAPQDALALIQDYGPPHHAVATIDPMDADFDSIKAAYKAGGYRAIGTEPIMANDKASPIRAAADVEVVRVSDMDLAAQIAHLGRSRQILPQHLKDPSSKLRLYCAMSDGAPVGWVRSIHVTATATWVSNLYVRQEHRRKGIGGALMQRMLRDDHELGFTHSVLAASTSGAQLYPRLGYEQVGLLQLFVPKKTYRSWGAV